MKILLVSDTHGNLDLLDNLIQKTEADAVIHAGDFGFYDKESVHRLQTRELRLLIQHSPYKNQYPITKETERELLIEIIQKHGLLGQFSDYLEGKKVFPVPIYAVWGNHEDLAVVQQLHEKHAIPNLFLLSDKQTYTLDKDILLYGIGGNWLPGKKLFDEPIAGSGGKIWATLSQFGNLYKKTKEHQGPSIFVSHVSPGKEPLLARLLTHFGPDLWISGHMGAPYPCLWNPFTVREEAEQIEWLSKEQDLIDNPPQNLSLEAQLAYDLLQKPLPSSELWFRKQWYLNLPDLGDGHAIFHIEKQKLVLETLGIGVL